MACMKVQHVRIIQRNRHLVFIILLPFAFLLFSIQGRQLPGADNLSYNKERENGERMMRSSLQIGSRPPRCDDQRCINCGGRCEAVQVPLIAPKLKLLNHRQESMYAAIAYSRGDDISNYKPMCWKCKCGDLFFNP